MGVALAVHGYILITFSELYNPAMHYRHDEFVVKYKKDIHIQPHIERPVLYLIESCPAPDEQLPYLSLSESLSSLNRIKNCQHQMD